MRDFNNGVDIIVVNGIIHIHFNKVSRIDLEKAKNILDQRNFVTQLKEYPQLVLADSLASISREAYKYWGEEAAKNISANAIVAKTPLTKMIFNIFSVFFSTTVPLKSFSKEEDALKWLEPFKNTSIEQECQTDLKDQQDPL